MARFVNLVYAVLLDGLDEEGRAELNAELDKPTEYELAQAQRYMDADAPPKAAKAPAWFDALPDVGADWAGPPRG